MNIAVDRRTAAEPRPPREPDRAAQVCAAPAQGAIRAEAGAERRRDTTEAGGGLGEAGPLPHAHRRTSQGQEVRSILQ